MQVLSKTVAPVQYFMTRDAEEFSEFDGHVACREYTLPRDDDSSTPRGWTRVHTKFGLVLKVTTNYHQRKPGIEIRIDSLSGDGSQSWVRISNGINTFVRDLPKTTRILGDDENSSPVIQESETCSKGEADFKSSPVIFNS